MIKNNYKKYLSSLYGVIIILILWYVLHIAVGGNMVPSPIETFEELIHLFKNDFHMHIIYSLYRITMSIGISLIIGVPLGIIIGMNDKLKRICSPVLYLLYPIPKIAFLPIFMVIFGIGDKSKIILMVTIIVFQILISTRDGVMEVDESILVSAKIMKFNRLDLCKEVILPAIAPKIFSSIRISTGIAISALFFSENYATRYGLGYFIMNSWSMVDYKEMFAGVVALSVVALIIYKVLDYLEIKICPWIK
ncbi:MAG: ABC transporter permease [Clostridium sp.]